MRVCSVAEFIPHSSGMLVLWRFGYHRGRTSQSPRLGSSRMLCSRRVGDSGKARKPRELKASAEQFGLKGREVLASPSGRIRKTAQP